jgi:hypothetical protein
MTKSAAALYIFSTLTSDNLYVNHEPSGNDMPLPLNVDGTEGVLIRGGAGVADERIITPKGVATQVTEAQVEYLRANKVFQLHERNGFIVVSDKNEDVEKMAADMASRDGSAPLVPNDFPEGQQPAHAASTGTSTKRK